MTTPALRASLALWRRRHTHRQERLDNAHRRNDAKAIRKWHALLAEAGRNIRLRQHQIAKRTKVNHNAATGKRARAVQLMYQARADCARRPWAWHYLAGGIANLICLVPSPRNYRSDCSQWAVNIDREAGARCPGSGTFMFSNTTSIARGKYLGGVPKVGAYGLYGSRWNPHHVERVAQVNPLVLVGHGTAPVDSRAPGLPNFYIDMED